VERFARNSRKSGGSPRSLPSLNPAQRVRKLGYPRAMSWSKTKSKGWTGKTSAAGGQSSPTVTFDEYCSRGEAATELIYQGRFDEAQSALRSMLDSMVASGEVDSFLLAKITQGMLQIATGRPDPKEALRLVTVSPDDDLLGVGRQFIGQGQTSVPDLMHFSMMVAHSFSCSTSDPPMLASNIDRHMRRVARWAAGEARGSLPMVLSYWRLFLNRVHGGIVPNEALVALREECADPGLAVPMPAERVSFPRVSAWKITW